MVYSGALNERMPENASLWIKSGDTLLSISRSQLNSTSRVGELIEMNKKRYPGLSLENPFIEVGWELILPPKEVRTSGNIRVTSGKLSAISENEFKWTVQDQSGSSYNCYIYKGDNPIIDDNVKVGECVDIIHDFMNSKKIYIINLQ